jgi:hypothetical protein
MFVASVCCHQSDVSLLPSVWVHSPEPVAQLDHEPCNSLEVVLSCAWILLVADRDLLVD